MKNDIEFFKEWSEKNDIPIFPVGVDKEVKSISWNDEHPVDGKLQDFLSFIEKIKPKFITFYNELFEYAEIHEEYEQTIEEIQSAKANDILLKFNAIDNKLESLDKEIYFYQISFFNEGFNFV
ncbi:MAG: hypothetical protein ACOCWM_02795, partial [Cyclobacteriaceae bacterium]